MGIEEQIDRLIDLGEDIRGRLDRLIEIGEKFCGPASSDQFVVVPESELQVMTFGEAIEKAKSQLQIVDAVVSVAGQPAEHSKDDHFVGAGKMVAEEPKKEPAEHPAGPKPDPGEGYRILSKDPPEELQPGDEFMGTEGQWVESQRAQRARSGWLQQPKLWYRRKIEQQTEPAPAWEPKVGDWVKVTRPEKPDLGEDLVWTSQMNEYDGKVLRVAMLVHEYQFPAVLCCGSNYAFRLDWLSPAEPPAKEEPPQAWEPKAGDWVKVTRPEKQDDFADPFWLTTMDQYDGKVFWVKEFIGLYQWPAVICEGSNYAFRIDWLSPAEPPATEEPPKPPEPEYREPVLPGDVTKQCEFSMTGEDWYESLLAGFQVHGSPWISSDQGRWKLARIRKDA